MTWQQTRQQALERNKYENHFIWAEGEFEKLEKWKSQIIIKLASRLFSAGMPKNMISAAIGHRLCKYVSSRYVQTVLADEYKNDYNYTTKRTSSQNDGKSVTEQDSIHEDSTREQKRKEYFSDTDIDIDTTTNTIICGDALTELRKFPSECVDTVIYSPPYWSLRDYQVEGQLGREKNYSEYVDKLSEIFGEVKRVSKILEAVG